MSALLTARTIQAILSTKVFLGIKPDGTCKLVDLCDPVAYLHLEVHWQLDSVLRDRITLTPGLVAALFAASENGVVSIEALLSILGKLSPLFEPTLTMGTSR